MADQPTVDLGIEGLEEAVEIGSGGFAVVYRAYQTAFRRTVAVKVLFLSSIDEGARRRFERERRAMGSLSEHPSIVTVFDAGFTRDSRPYLVMAYMPGGSLQKQLETQGAMGWQATTHIGVRLSGALEAAHQAGVIHRDVKPANVLTSQYGEPQLSDFGIARLVGGPETQSGVVTASIAHAAPEIIDGQPPSAASDVYSLASTMYALMTGAPAFATPTDESVLPMLLRIHNDPVPDLRSHGVPEAVAAVVEQAMAKDVAERPESAAAFGNALREAQRACGLQPTSMLLGFEHHADDDTLDGDVAGATVEGAVVADEPEVEPDYAPTVAGSDPVFTSAVPAGEVDPADLPATVAAPGRASAGGKAPGPPPPAPPGEDDEPGRRRMWLIAAIVVGALAIAGLGWAALGGGNGTFEAESTTVPGTSPSTSTTTSVATTTSTSAPTTITTTRRQPTTTTGSTSTTATTSSTSTTTATTTTTSSTTTAPTTTPTTSPPTTVQLAAQPDSATFSDRGQRCIPVLRNDSGSGLQLMSVSGANIGSAFVSGSCVSYTPADGIDQPSGYSETLTYTVRDNTGATDSSTLAITVS